MPDGETTRTTLLLRIKNGDDSAAWREFDGIYRPFLFRYARSKGLGEVDAEDVVQHCMAAIHRHAAGFDYDPHKGRFKSWLRTLVNNRIRNLFRDRKEQIAESRDFKELCAKEPSPDEGFDKLWQQEHLKHCLRLIKNQIEESTLKAFQTYVLEERPVDEVCKELNMTRNQVQLIKWRVTTKLSHHMKELLGEED